MKYDFVVVGGGFYGACLALALRSISSGVLLIERDAELFKRASKVNQARIHTGFHYPRSFVTAYRSWRLHKRFMQDFSEAIFDKFQMIYAIGRRKSKIDARRFYSVFSMMGAPIERLNSAERDLFNFNNIDDAFLCEEYAFDYTRLRDSLQSRLAASGIDVMLEAEVLRLRQQGADLHLEVSDGSKIEAQTCFNATYSQINSILLKSNLAPLQMKHELAELSLVEPPAELHNFGITVMDGPFFSIMPFPARGLHSLTHVRYTPHYSWKDTKEGKSPREYLDLLEKKSRWRHMVYDSARFVPAIADCAYKDSMYETKTVMTHNERDDGRPILFHQHKDAPSLISVLGGKIDNIYDLLEILPAAVPKGASLNTRFLFG